MKFLTIIFSLFILSLALMPCSDHEEHALAASDVMSGSHEHEEETESCTPFCICACCGTVVEAATFYTLRILEPEVLLKNAVFSAFHDSKITSIAYTVWQPPKLA